MRYLNMYDSLSCLNCMACMSACSMENRMRLERDKGVSLEKGVNDFHGAGTHAGQTIETTNTVIHIEIAHHHSFLSFLFLK